MVWELFQTKVIKLHFILFGGKLYKIEHILNIFNLFKMKIYPHSKDMKIQNIIIPRIPPYLWDISGYIGGILCLLYFNSFQMIYSSVFIMYGIINIIVETYTVSFDYTNEYMPTYNELNYYIFFITNKKYILLTNQVMKDLTKIDMIDNSRLVLEVNVYVGNNYIIKYFIYYVYLLGITKRNYTMKDYEMFKYNKIRFV